ncbi:MAG TPA: phospholipase C, phosphocholine-specific, partial [Burkholderiaceae bacterium]|nr:phospholipase C, phosphocholine-specific [Burkholderiaceae bacterium]
MHSNDRRDFLRRSLIGAGAAAALPALIQKALAIPAHRDKGTLEDVQHVVILMQENRSFDHYFGTLRGVCGFGDPRPATLPDGKPVWHQPGPDGEHLPFRPDAPDLGLQFMVGTPHDWPTTQRAWNEGRSDQWIAAKGPHTMAHFTRADIPFHYALADAFTVCDAYHCALLGPTDPNRYHLWTGCAGNDGAHAPVVTNAEAGYSWTTFPERLEAAGVSWKIYQDVGDGLDKAGNWGCADNAHIGNYGDNSLLYFDQYRNAAPGSPLYEKARTGTRIAADPKQGLFDILKADVAGGRLPSVSWIVAPEAYSEHPNWPANYGAWYIAQVLEALVANPEVWSRTALFITYDENDGFFDHVVPPTPAATPAQGLSTVDAAREHFPGDASYAAGPYGLGPRVPMLVVSPWTRGGWVCSEVFDHTSLIRFVERRFGAGGDALRETNISPWRRAVSGDLVSAFDFANPNASLAPLPATGGYVPADTSRHPDWIPAQPSAPALPRQEPGLRRSRALPYDFEVTARFDAADGRFALALANRGSAGAVLRLSATGSAAAPRSYTIEAGKQLRDDVAIDTSDFVVAGPGAFHRRFRDDPALAVDVRGEHRRERGGQLRLTLVNRGAAPVRLSVAPAVYPKAAPRLHVLAPGARVVDTWAVKDSAGWYDLAVTAEGSARFLRRLAGRVETG